MEKEEAEMDNNNLESTELVTLATHQVSDPDEWYTIVDFLNKTLKEKGFIFGLSKGNEEGTQLITVYEERES
jgi:hypothetical protein